MTSSIASSPTRKKDDASVSGVSKQDDHLLYDPKSLQYVEPTQTSLQCTICYEYFTDPVSSPCGHTFCRDCIRQAMEVNPGCPLCRTAIDVQSLYEVIALSRICDELLVFCPHKSLGCPHTCPRTQLGKHLKDECNYIGTMCRIEECRKKLLKKDLSEHMETCPYKRVDCLMCHSKVQRSQLSEHHKTCPAESVTCPHCNTTRTRLRHLEHIEACPQQIIDCTHGEFGCPWQGPRFELQALHIPQCPYEAIRGFLDMHKSKMQSLEQENQQLRSLFYDLRPQFQQLRDQVGDLAESVQLMTGLSQEGAVGAAGGNGAMFGFSDNNNNNNNATRASASAMARPSFVAAHGPYPPPPQQQYHSPNYNHPAGMMEPLEHHHHQSLLDNDLGVDYPHRRSSNMDPLLHHPHHPYYPTNDGDADEIIDPPEGVEGAVGGSEGDHGGSLQQQQQQQQQQLRTRDMLISENERIRSEMETLTAALASMELKQNMAIMTESIRMQEEIQSLRAVCHGLRMQMHYVLLERQQQHQQQHQGPPPPMPPQGSAGGAGASGSPSTSGSKGGAGGGGGGGVAAGAGGGAGGSGPKGPGGRPLSMGPGMRMPFMNSIGRQETKL
ncbi:hypothetical protein BGZ73_002025 [Actinomortierella ambigua]|nr:hypothetical protein BGZ73_002025 [Actinomortierella ambigua]